MSMTESETKMQIIRCIVGACDETCPHYWSDDVCHGSSEVASCAENALSELEQYRAIGTVSEFRELKEKATAIKADGFTDHLLNMGYRKAITEFAEAVKVRGIYLNYNPLKRDKTIGIKESVLDEIATELKGE